MFIILRFNWKKNNVSCLQNACEFANITKQLRMYMSYVKFDLATRYG